MSETMTRQEAAAGLFFVLLVAVEHRAVAYAVRLDCFE